MIKDKVIVALVQWSATDSEAVILGEERHGVIMDGMTHYYLHYTQGMKWVSGLGLTDFVIGDGSLDTHAQFGVQTGTVTDEDLGLAVDTIVSTVGLPILYKWGVTSEWRKVTEAGFSVYANPDGATNRLMYNQNDGGDWKLTEATDNRFVLCHVFATTGKNTKMYAIMGENQYNNANQARAGANTEISDLQLGTLPSVEMTPIATVIFQTGDYTGFNAKIVQTDEGEDYVDWRTTDLPRGTSPAINDHNILSGLQGGATGEYYHLTSAEATVVGNTSGTNTGDQAASAFDIKDLTDSLSKMDGWDSKLDDITSESILNLSDTPASFEDKAFNTLRVNSAQTAIEFIDTNVIDVPIDGDIAAYITAATAGDTLQLAAGTYTITSGLTVDKKLHIRGMGRGITTITCATNAVMVNFTTEDGSLISDLDVNYSAATTSLKSMVTGTASYTAMNVRTISTATGANTVYVFGFRLEGAKTANLHNCSFSGTGNVGGNVGIYSNTASSTINAYDFVATSANSSTSQYGANLVLLGQATATINLYGGSFVNAVDTAGGVVQCVAGAINVYGSVISGTGATAFDVKRDAGTLTLYNTTLVNNKTSGTITYAGTVAGSQINLGGTSLNKTQLDALLALL
jgi:hypothetical protein